VTVFFLISELMVLEGLNNLSFKISSLQMCYSHQDQTNILHITQCPRTGYDNFWVARNYAAFKLVDMSL